MLIKLECNYNSLVINIFKEDFDMDRTINLSQQSHNNGADWVWGNQPSIHEGPQQKKQKREAAQDLSGQHPNSSFTVIASQKERVVLLGLVPNKSFNVGVRGARRQKAEEARQKRGSCVMSSQTTTSTQTFTWVIDNNQTVAHEPIFNQITQIAQESMNQDTRQREETAVEVLQTMQEVSEQPESVPLQSVPSVVAYSATDLMVLLDEKVQAIDFSNGYDKESPVTADYPKITEAWIDLIALKNSVGESSSQHQFRMGVAVQRILRKIARDNVASHLRAYTPGHLSQALQLDPEKSPNDFKPRALKELEKLLAFPILERLKNDSPGNIEAVKTLQEGFSVIKEFAS
ncbi:MAG: hypothetical protein KDK71_02125 [Chlamydiia bacterium]|nr:hypothetical protein [Chlamydiia bacterium]